jgi:hypothetical protein
MESPRARLPLHKATAGFTQGAATCSRILTSPMNLGLMVQGRVVIPMASRALSGAFTADMASHTRVG